MIFSEPRFLLFFALVFGVHWILRGNFGRKVWLLTASLYFYGSWDWRFLGLILGCAVVDYFCASRIRKAQEAGRKGRRWLITSLCYDLGTLGFFKYFNFFADSGVDFLNWLGIPADPVTLQIVLPVGISFFTFQAMSYTIDVYRENLRPAPHFLDFVLFVTFFPQLVAGPIVRASEFLPQLQKKNSFKDVDVHLAFGQFLSGFVKKAVIADLIAGPVDAVFSAPAEYTAFSIAIAVLCYAIQIYCDFSGYSDMAIGTARLLGYELTKNFNFPYLATSITDFWRRWHISLSSWLRDYVYISLGGNRASEWKTHRNLLLTMLLGGLWHGAAWNFVLWGGVHGVALSVHRLWQRLASPGSSVAGQLAGWLSTLAFVVAALVLFRAGDLGTAAAVFRSMAGVGGGGAESLVPSTGVLVAGFFAAHFAAYRLRSLAFLDTSPRWSVAVGCGVVLAVAYALSPIEHVPFIYFQF